MWKLSCAAAAALALLQAPAARAANDADLAEIRKQIQNLKDDYESRIRALEERLKEAQAGAAAAQPAAPAPLPSASTANAGLAAFNPAISAVLQGKYAYHSAGDDRRGFSLDESEITLSANVDERFAGVLTVALAPENEISVEEAYATFAAPYGFAPKFGRFFSGIGYLNEQHAHAWDFVDAPLAYQAFLGGQYRNDGVQLKWIAPMDHFLEIGAEAGNSEGSNGVGAGALYAHTGGDVGASHSWRAGLSWLRTKASDLKEDTGVADFVWKWAPNGNARQTNFKLQGEYFRAYTIAQSGWYLQGVYQFMPQWRVGVRYDGLDPANDLFNPRKYTAMVDWNPSEFSRVRVQFARSQTVADVTDNQFFVQYILSLGAHGAHRY